MKRILNAYELLRDGPCWREMVHCIQYTRDPNSTAHRRNGYGPRDSAVFLCHQVLGERGIHATQTDIRKAMRNIDA